ncbi:MAG: T9SS type A sorting domain-containing protein [Bacteroidota bacterium]
MLVYPNPATTCFTIKLNRIPENIYIVYLYDLQGKEVFRETIKQTEQQFSISHLIPGIYIGRITDIHNVQTGHFKLLVKK